MAATSVGRVVLRGMGAYFLATTFLFAVAGRLDYWEGWVYTLVTLAFLGLTIQIFRRDPSFIAERQKPGPGVKSWDKTYMALSFLACIAMIVIAALDAGRFHWSTVPARLYGTALVLFAIGQSIFLWAKTKNRFFSSMVRIQKDRGRTVCRGGP